MVGWGIFLIIMGAGSLLMPMLGYQFTMMELVDPYQPYAGIVVAVIGAALVLMGMKQRPATKVAVTTQPDPVREPDAGTTEDVARPEDSRSQP